MSEHMAESYLLAVNDEPVATKADPVEKIEPTEPDTPPETNKNPTPKPRRAAASRNTKRVTVRNLTRRVVVAKDSNGAGIHIFPGLDVEISADLVGTDLNRKADIGLIALV